MAAIDVLKDLAVIIASITAIYGISSWRREFVGRRRIEIAEEVLALFYEARDTIRFMRSPLGYTGEGKTRTAKEGELAAEKDAKDQAYVLIERYNKNQEVFGRINTLRYRFMAQFGEEAARPFHDLNKIIIELFSASHQLAELRTENMFLNNRKEKKGRRAELEKVFWQGFPDDTIAPRVDAVVEKIEGTCRAAIKENTRIDLIRRIKKAVTGSSRNG